MVWRSLSELAQLDHDEPFADPLSRRRFMQLMGASIALSGGAGLPACRGPEDHIVPESRRGDDDVPGATRRFATAMELGGTAYGLLVTAVGGRPIKIDGNPEHPDTGRGSTRFMQASLLELYDPDRSRTALRRRGESLEPASALDVDAELRRWARALARTDGRGLRVLCEATTSPTIAALRGALISRHPAAGWHTYEPLARDHERIGTRDAFGHPMRVRLQLGDARVVVALDADLLGDEPDSLRLSRELAAGRDPDADPAGMVRLYAVESAFSATGAMADHRLPLRSELIKPFLLALEARVQGGAPAGGPAMAEPPVARFLAALASDLDRSRGRSAVAVGPCQPPEVHALAARLNVLLDNADRTVLYTAHPDGDRSPQIEDIARLAGDMRRGAVSMLLIVGGNPVYDAPADLDFAGALARVATSVHLSPHADETSALCTWHVPRAHFLEAWGDARTPDGTLTLAQPIIEPIFGGRSAISVLAQLVGRGGTSDQALVRETFDAAGPGGAPAAQGAAWRRALHDGFVPGSALAPERPGLQEFTALPLTATQREPRLSGGRLEVVFTPHPATHDGRFANNAWLQELPDFLTRMTWDSAALFGPGTAAELGIAHEDVIEIALDGRSVEVVAYVMPGQARSSIALALGQGRTRAGRVGGLAEDGVPAVGFDAYALRTSSAPFVAGGARVTRTGRSYRLALAGDRRETDSLGLAAIAARVPDLVVEATLADYRAPGYPAATPDGRNRSLFTEPRYDGHRWGMATDLSRCTGCSACVVACQAENNIPVVGKEQVARNREMHWLRIDRYFQGDPDAPRIARQPILCQQCENAPCEQVCPVEATVHSDEGLNDMVYNRCVGTRYCLNNCPYRVRRFNFLRWDWYRDMDGPRAQVRKLLFNPDVTVRSRGVMEKCTFCVQRIERAKIRARSEHRAIEDGEITTACQDACPTGAIVFGDLNDEKSRVAALHASRRAYALLAELDTRPRNVFLARIRNPHPDLG